MNFPFKLFTGINMNLYESWINTIPGTSLIDLVKFPPHIWGSKEAKANMITKRSIIFNMQILPHTLTTCSTFTSNIIVFDCCCHFDVYVLQLIDSFRSQIGCRTSFKPSVHQGVIFFFLPPVYMSNSCTVQFINEAFQLTSPQPFLTGVPSNWELCSITLFTNEPWQNDLCFFSRRQK